MTNPIRLSSIFAALALGAAIPASAAFVLQPDELTPSGSPGDSKDAKVYEMIAGPVTSNLDVYHPSTGANFISYIEFNLSTVPYASVDVTLATLDLYARAAAGTATGPLDMMNRPTLVLAPVVVTLSLVTSPWTEARISHNSGQLDGNDVPYDGQPTVGSVIASQIITAGGQFYSFDITNTVKDWLANPSTNYGVQITATTPAGEAFFYASGGSGGNAHPNSQDPKLTVVPEPSSTLALVGGVGMLMAFRSRRRAVAGR